MHELNLVLMGYIANLNYELVYWPKDRSEINWLFMMIESELKKDGYLDFEKDPPKAMPRLVR